jgi:hypothetical protein
MRKERPRVGIIYSGGPRVSLQSASLAKYIGAHLAATGPLFFVCSRPLFDDPKAGAPFA